MDSRERDANDHIRIDYTSSLLSTIYPSIVCCISPASVLSSSSTCAAIVGPKCGANANLSLFRPYMQMHHLSRLIILPNVPLHCITSMSSADNAHLSKYTNVAWMLKSWICTQLEDRKKIVNFSNYFNLILIHIFNWQLNFVLLLLPLLLLLRCRGDWRSSISLLLTQSNRTMAPFVVASSRSELTILSSFKNHVLEVLFVPPSLSSSVFDLRRCVLYITRKWKTKMYYKRQDNSLFWLTDDGEWRVKNDLNIIGIRTPW